MAVPTSRAAFTETCLRRLGKPVIKINVSDEQVSDRLDYALARFRDYHFDGTKRTYIPVEVTEQRKTDGFIDFSDSDLDTSANVHLSASLVDVVGVFPMSSSLMGVGMWNVTYQMLLTSLEVFRSVELSNYVIMMQNMQMMEEVLVGQQPSRFNRYESKLHIDTDWDRVSTGDFIVIDCYVTPDAATATKLWGDPWLLQYATAQIKHQWGSNLSKFDGMQMPGGLVFNGQKIKDEAEEEIRRLDAEVITGYSQPFGIYVG